MGIYALLAGAKKKDGPWSAVEPAQIFSDFFLTFRPIGPRAQAPPKRGPRAPGPILANSTEIVVRTCVTITQWGLRDDLDASLEG